MKKTLALLLSILMLAMMAVPAMAANAPVACPECEKNTLIYYMDVKPTCTEEGYNLWKCSNGECGHEEKYDIVAALGHDYPEVYDHVDGGCTKESYDHGYCTRCGKEDKINVVAAPKHNFVTIDTLPANCTEAERYLQECTACGETKTVNVPGGEGYYYHKMSIVVSAPQTCKDEAVIVYQCEKCDYQSSVATTPVDHVDENADGICDVCEATIELDDEPHGFYAQIIKWISDIVEAFKAFLASIKGDSIF